MHDTKSLLPKNVFNISNCSKFLKERNLCFIQQSTAWGQKIITKKENLESWTLLQTYQHCVCLHKTNNDSYFVLGKKRKRKTYCPAA